jgi:hypothetical protein
MNNMYTGIINLFLVPYSAPTRSTNNHVEQKVLDEELGQAHVNRLVALVYTL